MPTIIINICQPCLDGVGQECHTPECAFCLHAVDLPVDPCQYQVITGGWASIHEAAKALERLEGMQGKRKAEADIKRKAEADILAIRRILTASTPDAQGS